MVMLGTVGQGSQKSFVDAHRYHLPGTVPNRLSTTFAKPLDVVTPFSFVSPVLEVALRDWLAVNLLHTKSSYEKVTAPRVHQIAAPASV